MSDSGSGDGGGDQGRSERSGVDRQRAPSSPPVRRLTFVFCPAMLLCAAVGRDERLSGAESIVHQTAHQAKERSGGGCGSGGQGRVSCSVCGWRSHARRARVWLQRCCRSALPRPAAAGQLRCGRVRTGRRRCARRTRRPCLRVMTDPVAAIDVDKPADFSLVNEILDGRA